MPTRQLEEIVNIISKRLEQKKKTRILGFGASDTQRRSCGMHWLDCLELGLNQKFGPHVTIINSGVGGDTSKMLLERFDEDVSFYKPHLVIITTGGNDAVVEENNFSSEQFENNLRILHHKFSKLGTLVIFQTYYAFDKKEFEEEALERLKEFMQIVRNIAVETGSGLIDHHKRWLPLQEKDPDLYHSLMLDSCHLSEKGNLVMGSDIARIFKANELFKENKEMDESEFWKDSLKTIKLMDFLQVNKIV